MILNNGIRIQYEITRRTEFLFILNNIRKNIESYDKEENEKRNIISHRNKIDTKKEHTKKSYIRISKEIMNISGRQE